MGVADLRVKRHAPATSRNREPILDVLARVLPKTGTVLELASGSGEHAAFLASRLPGVTWQPSDPDADARASVEAYRAEAALPNLLAPLAIDARDDAARWGLARADAIVCINMIHIAPWASCEGLMRGAGALLSPGGVLYLYGPYKQGGAHTAPSNASFDEGLRARDPAWGVRDLEAVTREAEENGLAFVEAVPMPANNLSVVFARRR
jgi:cyclopropane fatty-acyl-phospholipid synthase-like methyltransferase